MHHFFFFVTLMSWLTITSVSAFAQGSLYKWVDPQGTVHYTNAPTKDTARSVDDALPPASEFQSPTPPPETAKADSEPTKPSPRSGGETSTSEAPPADEDTPEQTNDEPPEEIQPAEPDVSTAEDQDYPQENTQDDSGIADEPSE